MKGQGKAWWEVDAIVSGLYEGTAFVRRVLDHTSSQGKRICGNPATYGDLFRGKARDGPISHLGRPPEAKTNGTPQVSSVVQVPGKAKAESDECPRIQALGARLKIGRVGLLRTGVAPQGVLPRGFCSSIHGPTSRAPTKRLPHMGVGRGCREQYPTAGSAQRGKPSLTKVSYSSPLGG